MRGARLEALDELDLLGEHRLLALELRLLLLLVQRALLLVEFVVARIGRQRAAVDLHDLGDDAVHELAVVRGHQQRALVAFEELLEPDQAFEVEMVARLVEQHGVGAHEQDAGERHAHLPAARQRADVAVHHLLAEAQAREDFARAALERVAVQLLEARLHLAVARDDALHVVGAVRIGHGGLELLQLGRHGAHRAGAVHHLGHGAAARHLADVLAEIADGHAAIDGHLALVGLFLAGDHPEQRGLAGAVGADEADLLPLLERRGGLDEEDLVAILLADVVETNHVPGKTFKCRGARPAVRRGEKATARRANSPYLGCVPSPISLGPTASKWSAGRDANDPGFEVWLARTKWNSRERPCDTPAIEPKKSAPALRPGPEVVDQNHAGRLRGSSRSHNALARLTGESARGGAAQAAAGRKPDHPTAESESVMVSP